MIKKQKNIEYYEAVGRRKKSIARVRLYIKNIQDIKKGEIFVNKKNINLIYPDYKVNFLKKPLEITGNLDRFAISIQVKGGGVNGQLEAMIHGISRALVMVDENNKKLLKKYDLLKRDPRKKERKKVGTGGKARRKKQSPKR